MNQHSATDRPNHLALRVWVRVLVVTVICVWSAAALAQAEAVGSSLQPAPATERPAQVPVPAEPLRIAVISDLNERYGDQYHRDAVHTAVGQIVDLDPDIVLITGDMVAGQRPGLDYAGMWSAFHSAVTTPLAGVPVAIAAGNHDASAYERYVDERDVFAQQWEGRRQGVSSDAWPDLEIVDASHYPFRYSFAMGPVFFVALDATNRNAFSGREQLTWLEEQLSSASAAVHPVRIVFGHFPLYPFAQGRERDYLLADAEVRERVERLFVERDVTLYLSGHHHAFYPGRHPEHGFRLVSVGCLGGGPRVLLGDERVIDDLDDPTERSFVVVEVASGEIESLEAFHGPGFTPAERVDRSSLPEQVGETDLSIRRDDL